MDWYRQKGRMPTTTREYRHRRLPATRCSRRTPECESNTHIARSSIGHQLSATTESLNCFPMHSSSIVLSMHVRCSRNNNQKLSARGTSPLRCAVCSIDHCNPIQSLSSPARNTANTTTTVDKIIRSRLRSSAFSPSALI